MNPSLMAFFFSLLVMSELQQQSLEIEFQRSGFIHPKSLKQVVFSEVISMRQSEIGFQRGGKLKSGPENMCVWNEPCISVREKMWGIVRQRAAVDGGFSASVRGFALLFITYIRKWVLKQSLRRIRFALVSARSYAAASKVMTVRDALNSAIDEEMSADPKVFVMGWKISRCLQELKAFWRNMVLREFTIPPLPRLNLLELELVPPMLA